MKSFLILLTVAIVAVLIAFSIMGMLSKSGIAPGLVNGKLSACPNSPNCVCSEYPNDTSHFINPIAYTPSNPDIPLAEANAAILAMGGEILPSTEKPDYFAATFSSSVFGFVDDLEVRLESDNNLLHIRSASRVGHSDLGVNGKRVEALRQHLQN